MAMLFNFENSKCLYTRHRWTGVNCELGGSILCKTVNVKDMGNNKC